MDEGIDPIEKFRDFLATRGKQLTQERRRLVEEVCSTREPFDCFTMKDRLDNRKDCMNSSLSTVFRRLQELVEAGVIRCCEVRVDGRRVFERVD